MSKSINEVAQEAHTNAIEKGWWDAPRSFGELITLCHSELSEQNELLKKVAESYVRIINDLEEDCERYFDQRNRLIDGLSFK